MAPSPSDMLLFAAVVRHGSFTRAAERLGITKQSASERLGKLEATLRVRLLERTTRHLRLTDAGAAYYARCEAIATQIEEANQEVQRGQAEPAGRLRVSAPVLYGRRFLAPVVTAYMTRYPLAQVDVVLADRRVNLVEEGFDLAIRIGALDDSTLAARRLSEGHVHIVAAPSYLARHGKPTARTLGRARCVGMRAHETWTVGDTTHKVEPILVVNDLELACEAAIAGIGVARLPSLVCGEALADGRLRSVLDDPSTRSAVHAVYPSRRYLPAKTRAFLELVAELVAPLDAPPPRRR